MTIVGRATRCIVAWAVCLNRMPELMQSVVDAAPHARGYYSDAFNTYRKLCWCGRHTSMYDKSRTYSVAGKNADPRHYLPRLARPARCFSRYVHALTGAVGLFVRRYNARQLKETQIRDTQRRLRL